MQTWKWFASLLLVMSALAAATLACDLGDAVYGMTTPMPVAVLAATIASLPPPSLSNLGAAYSSNPDQLAPLYASGFAPMTPFSQLFGTMDQIATIKSLKNAIPDLKFTPRMTIVQDQWEAWSFDLSGTFTQPLVTANGTLPPTNQPWFTTVQMLVHFNADGKIDQEYSSADMVAMLHEAGVAGYENVKVGDNALEKPMTEITPSSDPAASAAADTLMAAVGNGPFLIWLPSGVQKNYYSTDVTYHSPYGDFINDASEVEDNLLQEASEPLEVPMIVRQGNLIGMAFTYTGSVDFPVEFADGTTIPANHQPIQFSGVVLGQVDARGNGEAWVMYNRLDNPITTDKFPVPGATEQATSPAPEATLTPAAPEASPMLTASATTASTSATCTISASQTVNLRAGAGTSFAIGGTLAAGQSAEADGQAHGSDGQTWLHIGSMNLWARSDIVTGDCAALPEIAANGN
ncbi:MAG: hypothetical protein ABI700_00670 [Chloroflexota bacterium]